MSSIVLGSTVVDALIGAGVTDVVLSPGSRSAALALALDRADKALLRSKSSGRNQVTFAGRSAA